METGAIHASTNVITPIVDKFPDFNPEIILTNDFSEFLLKMRRKQWDTWNSFLLNHRAQELSLTRGFEDVVVLTHMQEHWRQHRVIP